MSALLELDDVRVRYGAVEALKGISMTVQEGEIVTLLGANGAGKTTTLRTISGLLNASGGAIRFNGASVNGTPAHEIVGIGIGHVPEGRRIFPRMSVQENLDMGAYRTRGNNKVQQHIYELFPVLEQRRTQDGGTLSGGEQQMLAIGRALMSAPRLLLLDEPSMGLAPLVTAKIFEILEEINRDGTTVLLVEQNAAQALKLAARGYVLETGAIVMDGEASGLLSDDRVRAAYLGEEIGTG